MKAIRLKFVAIAAVVTLTLVGGVVAVQWKEIRARYAGYCLRSAADDAARSAAVRTLLTLGEPGADRVCEAILCGPAAVRSAASAEVQNVRADDLVLPMVADRCVATFSSADDAGKNAILDLVPVFLLGDASVAKELVKLALVDGSPDVRETAILLAVRPDVGLAAAVVPLLDNPAAEVRRAAAIALAPPPASGSPAIVTENLFRRLNDPDPDVRALVAAGLKARGLSVTDVAFGRKLGSPVPEDRLELLFELRWAGGAVKDPGPWLQRLAGDAEPAVRAGAARVAVELGVAASAGWVGALADRDPDETVRLVAGFYRGRARDLRTVGYQK
ncbi:MAG TPA: hypothetical protein VGJ05_09750 [Fimbriiglobus sp.]|jgi:hypothetical protein